MSKIHWYLESERKIIDLVEKYGINFHSIKKCHHSEMGMMGQCFGNAGRLMMTDPDKYIYCEGYATSHGDPYLEQHGWVIDHFGNVYDPTWSDGNLYLGIPFKYEYTSSLRMTHLTFRILESKPSSFLHEIWYRLTNTAMEDKEAA